MLIINVEKWNSISNDCKGVFSDYHGDNPEWKGKKTVMEGCLVKNASSKLLIEGVHFVIN